MSEKSVLIVSATAGTGHIRAGDAILSAVRRYQADWHAEHVDVLALAPRWVKTAYGGGFELVAAHAPRLWRGAYALADGPDADRARWAGIARRILFRAFERLLTSRHWDHVVCTHFLPAQLAAGRMAGPPFTVVVTDFDLHRFWVQPRVRHYCVATPELEQQLRSRLDAVHVSRTGIPIDPAFDIVPDAMPAKRQLGLDPRRPVIVVMGGGLGIGVVGAARSLAEALPPHVQIAVLCGRNADALQQLCNAQIPASRMRCFGYRVDMPNIYAAAELVVTKPGGLTCSEALALGKPLLLMQPIPGHEEANVRVLTSAGAALAASDGRQLAGMAASLLGNAADLQRLRVAAYRFAQPGSAHAIVEQIAAHTFVDAAA